ncbi:MAG: hypothetical protein KAS62_09325 [Candidatus Delongbacteria bacterium]|nr:hypothetical protein [Candidatus Delongbacteria bacterium]
MSKDKKDKPNTDKDGLPIIDDSGLLPLRKKKNESPGRRTTVIHERKSIPGYRKVPKKPIKKIKKD